METARALALLLLAAAIFSPARASTEACKCKHLESLQQEVENAEYEAKFFADLSKRLDAIEKKQADINKNDPSNRDAGVAPASASAQARDKAMANEFKLPNPAVKDYKGPKEVSVEKGKCTNALKDLEGLRDLSSCKEIGEATLKHEEEHRDICNRMGAEKYWTRLPSLIAAEEAERYAHQAAAIRDLLKKAIDGGKFRLSHEQEVTMTGQGFNAVYFYSTAPYDLEGKSKPGEGRWTLKGEGRQSGVIRRVNFPGMSCTPSGQLNDKSTGTLDTDGLKMGLSIRTDGLPGDVSLKCKAPGGEGFGMSMRPPGESGSGEVFKDKKVSFLTETTEDVANMEFARTLAANGMSATGYAKATLELVCPAE